MTLQNLYNDLLEHLEVRTYPLRSSIDGNNINPDETFKLRIEVSNRAPHVRFTDAQVRVRSTSFARPVDGNVVTQPLEPSTLNSRGEPGYATILMKATKTHPDMPGLPPGTNATTPEFIANIDVIADVDFGIRKRVHATYDIVLDND